VGSHKKLEEMGFCFFQLPKRQSSYYLIVILKVA